MASERGATLRSDRYCTWIGVTIICVIGGQQGMGTSLEPVGGPVVLDSPAIREQLDRVLASPHFRNSKRCQALLRFATESVLEGQPDDLREKIIGAKVFGRAAAYDTAHDAVVRNVATEVRRRLAQYYLEDGHERELRIEFHSGSYLPTFTPHKEHPAPPVPPVPESKTRTGTRVGIWKVATLAAMLMAGAGAVVYHGASSDFDRFWEPVFRAHEVVQICVGQPGRLYRFLGPRQAELDGYFAGPDAKPEASRIALAKAPIDPSEIRWNANRYLYVRDAFAMARLAALVQAKGCAFRLSPDTTTSYAELRRSPVIAIGGFNNHWVLRFGGGMRYLFEHTTVDGVAYNSIADRRDPNANKWMASRSYSGVPTEDYAIITRAIDPSTERTIVLVAGIDDYGTLAAGEFITDAGYMNAAFRDAPRGSAGE
jgi:hypothetical protein